MSGVLQPYSRRESPSSYDPGWFNTEHDNIKRAIGGAEGALQVFNVAGPPYRALGKGDDSDRIQAALNDANSVVSAALVSVNGLAGSTSAFLPLVWFPYNKHTITKRLTYPPYVRVMGENTAITQSTAGTDIFYGDAAARVEFSGLSLQGGRHAIYYRNDNFGSGIFRARNCEFHVQTDYAIRLGDALAGGDCGSTLAEITDSCQFYRAKRVLYTRCDRTEFKHNWVHISGSNFDANSAAFMNASGDLVFDCMFGIPEMNYGGSRLANVRWVDNYGSFYSKNSRFGGEDAGLGIVWHFATPGAGADPFTNGPAVVIEGGYISAGPSAGADSGIIHLRTEVPQLITIRDVQGITSVPLIANTGGLNLDTYFDTYTAPQAKWRFNIDNNLTWAATALPAQLLGYTTSWDFAQSTALPTSGYYQVGKYIKKTTPVVAGGAGSQYVIKGWTRLTDGKTHVLNTDWVEDRALTGT